MIDIEQAHFIWDKYVKYSKTNFGVYVDGLRSIGYVIY